MRTFEELWEDCKREKKYRAILDIRDWFKSKFRPTPPVHHHHWVELPTNSNYTITLKCLNCELCFTTVGQGLWGICT